MSATYTFSAELWEWTSKASWYFVSLPEADADDIDERQFVEMSGRKGFGVKADDLLDGTTAIAPNLTAGTWEVGGVAVTATAAAVTSGVVMLR